MLGQALKNGVGLFAAVRALPGAAGARGLAAAAGDKFLKTPGIDQQDQKAPQDLEQKKIGKRPPLTAEEAAKIKADADARQMEYRRSCNHGVGC